MRLIYDDGTKRDVDTEIFRMVVHSAEMHFQFMRRQEGSLPPTEVAAAKLSLEIQLMISMAELHLKERKSESQN